MLKLVQTQAHTQLEHTEAQRSALDHMSLNWLCIIPYSVLRILVRHVRHARQESVPACLRQARVSVLRRESVHMLT